MSVSKFGGKGGCFVMFLGAVLLLVLLLIWVYRMNFDFIQAG